MSCLNCHQECEENFCSTECEEEFERLNSGVLEE